MYVHQVQYDFLFEGSKPFDIKITIPEQPEKSNFLKGRNSSHKV